MLLFTPSCSAPAPPLPPVSSTPVVTSSGPASPSPAPSTPSPPVGTVRLDRKATLLVGPVDYGDRQVVKATFGAVQRGRLVSLQRQTPTGWLEVASDREDSSGSVEYLVPFATDAYRAVATELSGGGASAEPVATPTASVSSTWRTRLTEGFSGSRLSSRLWSVRQPGLYTGSRLCSAVRASMSKVSGGELRSSVDRAGAARTRAARASAARQQGIAVRKACPYGVYDNSMVSTEQKFSFRYGTVAARVKFPSSPGQHASVWLQPVDGSLGEVDIVETFGLGWQFQHKLYYKGSGGKTLQAGGYVKTVPEVKSSGWWDEYHVVSVDWTRGGYVFRVDGVETYRTTKGANAGPKFLILSLLASDWELSRMKQANLPTSLTVDWVKVWQRK